MAALTDSRYVVKQFIGQPRRVPVGTDIVYKGGMVMYGSGASSIVAAADTAGAIFAGVANEEVDNSAGASGVTCEIYQDGIWPFVIAGAAAGDEGNWVYVSDDQTVTETQGNVAVGVIMEVVSATEVRVDIGVARAFADTSGMSFTSPNITTGLNDTNGVEMLGFTPDATPVNNWDIGNGDTGVGVTFSATGTDANIDALVAGKGTGTVTVGQATGSVQLGTVGTDKIGMFGTAPVVQQTASSTVSATQDTLTDSTGGSANTTLVDCVTEAGGATITAGDGAKIKDNFADIAAQLAKIKTDIAALIAQGNAHKTALDNVGLTA